MDDTELSVRREIDDPSRGRRASTPSEIPARGWKDILWRVYENINEHRIMAVAAVSLFLSCLRSFPELPRSFLCTGCLLILRRSVST